MGMDLTGSGGHMRGASKGTGTCRRQPQWEDSYGRNSADCSGELTGEGGAGTGPPWGTVTEAWAAPGQGAGEPCPRESGGEVLTLGGWRGKRQCREKRASPPGRREHSLQRKLCRVPESVRAPWLSDFFPGALSQGHREGGRQLRSAARAGQTIVMTQSSLSIHCL